MRKATINRLFYETVPKRVTRFVMIEKVGGRLIERPSGREVSREYADPLPSFTLNMGEIEI